MAPIGLPERIIELIERERGFGKDGRIIAKMNALVDPEVIRALYRASQAGVKIDLLVRGICCLRPGVPGVSENIQVLSVVDRFLEHARIFYFEAGGKQEVYLSSADWMPRNFIRRVEVMFPVEDAGLRDRLVDEILQHRPDRQRARRAGCCATAATSGCSRRRPTEARRCAASSASWSWPGPGPAAACCRRRPGRRLPQPARPRAAAAAGRRPAADLAS